MSQVVKKSKQSPLKAIPGSEALEIQKAFENDQDYFSPDMEPAPNLPNKAKIKPSDQSFVKIVTSLGLKRTHQGGALKYAKIIFKDDVYREILVVGIKKGVVWDEIVRALIDRELASIDPFAGLENFLPE